MLTGPLFMLQVYDRVLTSRSTATLSVLFAIVLYCYVLMGLLDIYRGRVLARIGAKFQASLDRRVYDAVLAQNRTSEEFRAVTVVRTALASTTTGAVFDLPWVPIFIGVLFVFHPAMGSFAIFGVFVVFALALVNHYLIASPQSRAAVETSRAEAHAVAIHVHYETVRGLGMASVLGDIWQDLRMQALGASLKVSDAGSAITSLSRSARMMMQSGMLGVGALLVIQGHISGGVMVAGSILLGRALSPVEQVVSHWPHMQRAILAWKSLDQTLSMTTQRTMRLPLPRPAAHLEVTNLAVAIGGQKKPTLQGISFNADAGDAIAVIGPLAAGKSTFAKAIVGILPVAIGDVRLGGATLEQYDSDQLGRYFGYLPQDVVLFNGTIAQNIARFSPDADPQLIIEAAKAASAHDMILGLPDGYDTVVDHGATALSGGQRQRIGLARALFGDPVALVLDEPNAHLDDVGVQALNDAISNARRAGKVVFVMAHRPSALVECNKVMVLRDGQMRAFGPRDAVLQKFVQPRGISA
ncbi:type I secretion system permease/ATPase [Marivivens sp. JLT3646]|uniref:type I secretion system permease/ATPase n=1 Tax=Marivivens sp. JLT3646 TaxID=1920883 RepID=UPI001E36E22B|nr:type I secretion system permease/ATPase [Marivivens sp. JLT3646]